MDITFFMFFFLFFKTFLRQFLILFGLFEMEDKLYGRNILAKFNDNPINYNLDVTKLQPTLV
jgi:hypothetical protein